MKRPWFVHLRGVPRFLGNAWSYSRGREPNDPFPMDVRYLNPRTGDRYELAGTAKGHYFHQDLWAARKICRAAPREHVDVGSRMDGFVAHLLVFRDVTVIDIRALESPVRGLTFKQGDITALPLSDNSVESLSCLHALEHIGLGRYGDRVDPNGWRRGLAELQRVLSVGGLLYLGVPIGHQRLCFDAHRVFFAATILEAAPRLDLLSFAYVDDAGDLHEDQNVDAIPRLNYGCGLFEFTKRIC